MLRAVTTAGRWRLTVVRWRRNRCEPRRAENEMNAPDNPVESSTSIANGEPTWDALLARVAAGDGLALGVLYDGSSTIVYSVALRILGKTADAEEVTIDVYTYLWRSAATYDPDRGTVATWLIMLTRSRALGRLRTVRAANRTNGAAGADQPLLVIGPVRNGSMPACDRQILMDAALNHLPGSDRELISLAFFKGLSHTELAEALDMPLGTVKTRIRAAMLRLLDLVL